MSARQAIKNISSHYSEDSIDIYPSIWRVIGIILAGSLLAVGGYIMTIHPRIEFEKYIGYIATAFFGFAVIVGFTWLIMIAMRKPIARIYDDRLEYLILARLKYEVIPFLHVEMFVISKAGAKLIRADLLNGSFKDTVISDALVPVGKVCDILNNRLERFWEMPRV